MGACRIVTAVNPIDDEKQDEVDLVNGFIGRCVPGFVCFSLAADEEKRLSVQLL